MAKATKNYSWEESNGEKRMSSFYLNSSTSK